MAKRSARAEKAGRSKRVRTESDGKEATPHRVAAIRSRAKAKGLGTPSPGRAHAALTMLELTNSSKREESKCSRSLASTLEMSLEYDSQTVQEVTKRLVGMFGSNGTHIVDTDDLVNKNGFNESVLEEALGLLAAFDVVFFDTVSGFYIWNGCMQAFNAIGQVIKKAQLSSLSPTSPSPSSSQSPSSSSSSSCSPSPLSSGTVSEKVQIARRALAHAAKDPFVNMALQVEKSVAEPKPWTVEELAREIGANQSDMHHHVHSVVEVFCELSLVKNIFPETSSTTDATSRSMPQHDQREQQQEQQAESKDGADEGERKEKMQAKYCWNFVLSKPTPTHSSSPEMGNNNTSNNNSVHGTQTPAGAEAKMLAKRLITPSEPTNKAHTRPTPQSADQVRMYRRVRPTIRTEKSISRRVLDDENSAAKIRTRSNSSTSSSQRSEFPKKKMTPGLKRTGSMLPSTPADISVKGNEPPSTGRTMSSFSNSLAKVCRSSVPSSSEQEPLLVSGGTPLPTRANPLKTDKLHNLSYLGHPLPNPRVDLGEPSNAAVVTQSFLQSGGAFVETDKGNLPTVEEMIQYQITCFKTYIRKYAEFYKMVHPEWKPNVPESLQAMSRAASLASCNSLAMPNRSDTFAQEDMDGTIHRADTFQRAPSFSSVFGTGNSLERSDTLASFTAMNLQSVMGDGLDFQSTIIDVFEGLENSEASNDSSNKENIKVSNKENIKDSLNKESNKKKNKQESK